MGSGRYRDRVRSRVLGRDIDIPISRFADLLHLSSGGVDVYIFDLNDFEYPDGESALTASTLIHGDDNPGLVRNEEVNKFTLTSQVLAKFIFYNILPKSCLLYTSPSPRDRQKSRMPSSA